jgi:hypothetical protein
MTTTNDNHPTAEALDELEAYLAARTAEHADPDAVTLDVVGFDDDEHRLRVSTLRALLQLARSAQARVYLDHGGADWGVIVAPNGEMLYQGHVSDVYEHIASDFLGANLHYVDTISDDIRAQPVNERGRARTKFAPGSMFDADGRVALP